MKFHIIQLSFVATQRTFYFLIDSSSVSLEGLFLSELLSGSVNLVSLSSGRYRANKI